MAIKRMLPSVDDAVNDATAASEAAAAPWTKLRGWEAASAPAHAAAAARNAADGEVVRTGADAAGGRRREFEAAVVPTMAVLTDELEAATRWRDEARATLGQERLMVDAAISAEGEGGRRAACGGDLVQLRILLIHSQYNPRPCSPLIIAR